MYLLFFKKTCKYIIIIIIIIIIIVIIIIIIIIDFNIVYPYSSILITIFTCNQREISSTYDTFYQIKQLRRGIF